jgi:hypothetical protein
MSGGRAAAARWLARLYGAALRLYPEGVRREYAQEMQAVFALKAADSAQRGGFALVGFTCREARDLPGAIVRTHLNERKAKMKLAVGNQESVGPLKAWKIAAVFLPFVLGLLFTANKLINGTVFGVLGFTLLGLLIVIWVAGVVKAFPVWALPSLGMLFFIFYFYFLKQVAQYFIYTHVIIPHYGSWPGDDLSLGIPILLLVGFGTILTVGGMLGILFLFPKIRGWVRKDWTLLSFFLYGMAILPMFMDDEFHHLEPYQCASLLLMTAGAGLYLKAPFRWQRILVLVIPVILSQALFILGLYQTYPLESWSNLANPTQRTWEALQPLTDPLPILLLLPAFVHLTPRSAEPARAPSEKDTPAARPTA